MQPNATRGRRHGDVIEEGLVRRSASRTVHSTIAAAAFRRVGAGVLIATLAAACGEGPAKKVAPDASSSDDHGPIVAPELDGGVAWLNTDRPLTLAELAGNVVVLDFWTFGCINCINMVPVYRKIEDRFAGEPFAVIGVHSGNSDKERDPDNVRVAVETLDIRHPVVVDSNHAIWDRYGVSSWPTALVIDARGNLRFLHFGEFSLDDIEPEIQALIDEARADGIAADPPFDYLADPPARDQTALRFPGKVTVVGDGRVAVADTAHHRVVIATPDGQLERVVGTGDSGWVDGAADAASFQRPHGLAEVDGGLLVADTLNHVVRRVELDSGQVSTLAGTGHLEATGYSVADGWMPAAKVDLRAPWALEVVDDGVAIAAAGSHQILVLDPAGERLRVLAGTGAEGMDDGPAAEATFAQPSGLARSSDGTTLYVADPESSAVRAVSLADGSVTTLVGHGLMMGGDQDGAGDAVFLQHVSGLAMLDDATLLLVDTFNSKIKSLDPESRAVMTVGWAAGETGVDQPEGVARQGDTVYVADTNHHRILRHDLVSGETTVFGIEGLVPPPKR